METSVNMFKTHVKFKEKHGQSTLTDTLFHLELTKEALKPLVECTNNAFKV